MQIVRLQLDVLHQINLLLALFLTTAKTAHLNKLPGLHITKNTMQ